MRRAIYHLAVHCSAMYADDTDPTKLGRYQDNDLHMTLLFHGLADKNTFLSEFLTITERSLYSAMDPSCFNVVSEGLVPADSGRGHLYRLTVAHYVRPLDPADLNPSPENSASVTSASSAGDATPQTERQLQCVEAVQGHKLIGAHIAQKATNKKKARLSNNFLYCTRLFHDYFDGDNCPVAPTPELQTTPRVRIRYLHHTDPLAQFGNRCRVHVEVEFIDATHATSIPRIQMKDGSTKVDALRHRTFVHVHDPEQFRSHLETKWRQENLDERWEQWRNLQLHAGAAGSASSSVAALGDD